MTYRRVFPNRSSPKANLPSKNAEKRLDRFIWLTSITSAMPYEYMCASVKRCAIITNTSTIKVTQPSVTLPYENLSLIFLFSFQSSSTRKPCTGAAIGEGESCDKQPLDRKPPGGTRYILGWGGAARPLISWPCLRQKSLIFLPCSRQNSDFWNSV